ncbi:hypothetical protein D8674_010694 [Pyrus ussuriensis x Pyrus communis]|uniref:Uncharacterized protein n=1 Tax=Pyrus ussuriensis x Pyrus communis TaxID=2448454 RepID=A0A5N5FC70_9ROSA|nr:hypothetical protein D8674_010694 [Pyrus ussuriensis x Pyrus communis]
MHRPCFVETIEGRENMISGITRWDTSMMHKAIKDIPGENIKNVINNDEGNDHNVNKNTEQTDEPENISINEAQTEFDKLFGEEMIKLDATVQKHIIGMDTIISEELFDEFKKARSIAKKRYITFREMMAHAMDASNRECLILGQTIKMLNIEVKKILQKVEINKKNSSAHNAKMLKMQTKTMANILKINDYLKQIRSLKKKLEETQSKATEMKSSQIPYLSAFPQGLPDPLKDKKEPSLIPHAAEIKVQMKTPTVEPMSNVAKMEVEKTLIAEPIIPIAEDVQKDINEGKQSITERKEHMRTLVRNVHAKDDCK